MAVFPVPGCPPIKMALPAILPSLIMLRIIPAALLALIYQPLILPQYHLLVQPYLVKFFLVLENHLNPILQNLVKQ